jgi:hypothetical protein
VVNSRGSRDCTAIFNDDGSFLSCRAFECNDVQNKYDSQAMSTECYAHTGCSMVGDMSLYDGVHYAECNRDGQNSQTANYDATTGEFTCPMDQGACSTLLPFDNCCSEDNGCQKLSVPTAVCSMAPFSLVATSETCSKLSAETCSSVAGCVLNELARETCEETFFCANITAKETCNEQKDRNGKKACAFVVTDCTLDGRCMDARSAAVAKRKGTCRLDATAGVAAGGTCSDNLDATESTCDCDKSSAADASLCGCNAKVDMDGNRMCQKLKKVQHSGVCIHPLDPCNRLPLTVARTGWTSHPTTAPTGAPSWDMSLDAMTMPTSSPTWKMETFSPTTAPTAGPTATYPTFSPTSAPTAGPTATFPTFSPTAAPTSGPTCSDCGFNPYEMGVTTEAPGVQTEAYDPAMFTMSADDAYAQCQHADSKYYCDMLPDCAYDTYMCVCDTEASEAVQKQKPLSQLFYPSCSDAYTDSRFHDTAESEWFPAQQPWGRATKYQCDNAPVEDNCVWVERGTCTTPATQTDINNCGAGCDLKLGDAVQRPGVYGREACEALDSAAVLEGGICHPKYYDDVQMCRDVASKEECLGDAKYSDCVYVDEVSAEECLPFVDASRNECSTGTDSFPKCLGADDSCEYKETLSAAEIKKNLDAKRAAARALLTEPPTEPMPPYWDQSCAVVQTMDKCVLNAASTLYFLVPGPSGYDDYMVSSAEGAEGAQTASGESVHTAVTYTEQDGVLGCYWDASAHTQQDAPVDASFRYGKVYECDIEFADWNYMYKPTAEPSATPTWASDPAMESPTSEPIESPTSEPTKAFVELPVTVCDLTWAQVTALGTKKADDSELLTGDWCACMDDAVSCDGSQYCESVRSKQGVCKDLTGAGVGICSGFTDQNACYFATDCEWVEGVGAQCRRSNPCGAFDEAGCSAEVGCHNTCEEMPVPAPPCDPCDPEEDVPSLYVDLQDYGEEMYGRCAMKFDDRRDRERRETAGLNPDDPYVPVPSCMERNLTTCVLWNAKTSAFECEWQCGDPSFMAKTEFQCIVEAKKTTSSETAAPDLVVVEGPNPCYNIGSEMECNSPADASDVCAPVTKGNMLPDINHVHFCNKGAASQDDCAFRGGFGSYVGQGTTDQKDALWPDQPCMWTSKQRCIWGEQTKTTKCTAKTGSTKAEIDFCASQPLGTCGQFDVCEQTAATSKPASCFENKGTATAPLYTPQVFTSSSAYTMPTSLQCLVDRGACCGLNRAGTCDAPVDEQYFSLCETTIGHDASYCGPIKGFPGGCQAREHERQSATAATCGKYGGCTWIVQDTPAQLCTPVDECASMPEAKCMESVDQCTWAPELYPALEGDYDGFVIVETLPNETVSSADYVGGRCRYLYTGNECPNSLFKSTVGVCGCDVPDTDTDGDGTPDCADADPADQNNAQQDPGFLPPMPVNYESRCAAHNNRECSADVLCSYDTFAHPATASDAAQGEGQGVIGSSQPGVLYPAGSQFDDYGKTYTIPSTACFRSDIAATLKAVLYDYHVSAGTDPLANQGKQAMAGNPTGADRLATSFTEELFTTRSTWRGQFDNADERAAFCALLIVRHGTSACEALYAVEGTMQRVCTLQSHSFYDEYFNSEGPDYYPSGEMVRFTCAPFDRCAQDSEAGCLRNGCLFDTALRTCVPPPETFTSSPFQCAAKDDGFGALLRAKKVGDLYDDEFGTDFEYSPPYEIRMLTPAPTTGRPTSSPTTSKPTGYPTEQATAKPTMQPTDRAITDEIAKQEFACPPELAAIGCKKVDYVLNGDEIGVDVLFANKRLFGLTDAHKQQLRNGVEAEVKERFTKDKKVRGSYIDPIKRVALYPKKIDLGKRRTTSDNVVARIFFQDLNTDDVVAVVAGLRKTAAECIATNAAAATCGPVTVELAGRGSEGTFTSASGRAGVSFQKLPACASSDCVEKYTVPFYNDASGTVVTLAEKKKAQAEQARLENIKAAATETCRDACRTSTATKPMSTAEKATYTSCEVIDCEQMTKFDADRVAAREVACKAQTCANGVPCASCADQAKFKQDAADDKARVTKEQQDQAKADRAEAARLKEAAQQEVVKAQQVLATLEAAQAKLSTDRKANSDALKRYTLEQSKAGAKIAAAQKEVDEKQAVADALPTLKQDPRDDNVAAVKAARAALNVAKATLATANNNKVDSAAQVIALTANENQFKNDASSYSVTIKKQQENIKVLQDTLTQENLSVEQAQKFLDSATAAANEAAKEQAAVKDAVEQAKVDKANADKLKASVELATKTDEQIREVSKEANGDVIGFECPGTFSKADCTAAQDAYKMKQDEQAASNKKCTDETGNDLTEKQCDRKAKNEIFKSAQKRKVDDALQLLSGAEADLVESAAKLAESCQLCYENFGGAEKVALCSNTTKVVDGKKTYVDGNADARDCPSKNAELVKTNQKVAEVAKRKDTWQSEVGAMTKLNDADLNADDFDKDQKLRDQIAADKKAEDDKKAQTTIIIVVVVVVLVGGCVAGLATGAIGGHRLNWIGGALGNPFGNLFGGGGGGGGPGGVTYSNPAYEASAAPGAAKTGSGLIRQESMC